MADQQISVQPASPAPATAAVQVKVFSAVDLTGAQTLIQAMAVVDETGRPLVLMTDKTGQDLLQAIKDLHQAIVDQGQGGFAPRSPGLAP